MKNIRALLTEADPLRSEPEMSDADAARMRRVVVSSGREAQAGPGFWASALAVAAVVILMVVAGALAGRRLPARESSVPDESAAVMQPAERRQLQFATPGGTRIIWTLDPEFQLKGVVP